MLLHLSSESTDESVTSISCRRERVFVLLLWYTYNWQGEAVCAASIILLKLMKSFIEDLLIFEYEVRAERPLFINF